MTGARSWNVRLPDQYSFSSPPTAANGVVYVDGAGSGGTLYAVGERAGDILWTRPVANGDMSSPALSPTSVFVSFSCPQSYGFERADGTPLWHYSGACEGGGGKMVAYHRDRVYVRGVLLNSPNGLVLSARHGETRGTYGS